LVNLPFTTESSGASDSGEMPRSREPAPPSDAEAMLTGGWQSIAAGTSVLMTACHPA
jgi:hypothetical protein